MATKTWWMLHPTPTPPTAPGYFGKLQDGGTAPSASSGGWGWQVAKTSVATPYFRGRSTGVATVAQASSFLAAQTGPVAGTGATATTSADSLVTPSAYTGTFAAGAWTLNLVMRAATVTLTGRLQMRVWASVNADGSAARELTSAVLVGQINIMSATGVNYASGLTWSPGAITLSNEYLFFQFEWQETTAGTSNSSANTYFQGTSSITSTDFSTGPTTTTLTAAAGSYTTTGAAAALLLKHVAAADSYALTGSDATFTIAVPPITLSADAGAYTLIGSNAALTLRHVAGSGSYSLTGSSAGFAFKHAAGTGAYTLTGTAAGLNATANMVLDAAAGSYALTGSAAALVSGDNAVLATDPGSYTLTGSAAAFGAQACSQGSRFLYADRHRRGAVSQACCREWQLYDHRRRRCAQIRPCRRRWRLHADRHRGRTKCYRQRGAGRRGRRLHTHRFVGGV